jgi:hypothetical protein
MTRDDIIKLAREAAQMPQWSDRAVEVYGLRDMAMLERFAALVAVHSLVEPCCQQFDKCQKVCMPRAAAAEREACAKECEHTAVRMGSEWMAHHCAAAIRARGQDPMPLFEDWPGGWGKP